MSTAFEGARGELSRALRAAARPREILRSRGMVSLFDQGIVSLANFLTGALVGRSCPKEELGLYSLGFSVLLFCTGIQSAVISVPYTIYSPQVAERERAAYSGSSLVHQLVLSSLAAAVVGGGALVLGVAGQPSVAALLAMVAVALPFPLVREYGRQLLFARLRFPSALALDGAVAGLQLALLLSLRRLGLLSARSAYAAVAAACGAGVLLAAMAAWRWFQIRRERVLPDLRANWATGRWALTGGMVGIASYQLYPWFLAATRGTAEAGALAACTGVTVIANPILIALGNLLVPKTAHAFARGGVPALGRVVRQGTLALAGVMAVVTPAMLVGGRPLLGLVYGDRYLAYGLTVGLLSLSQAVDVVAVPAACALYAMGKPSAAVKGNAIALAVTVTLGLPFVHLLGPLGVATGLVLGNGLSAAFRWREYARELRARAARPAVSEPSPPACMAAEARRASS
jgi:O-antigen/teichoic acid export membrane protein